MSYCGHTSHADGSYNCLPPTTEHVVFALQEIVGWDGALRNSAIPRRLMVRARHALKEYGRESYQPHAEAEDPR